MLGWPTMHYLVFLHSNTWSVAEAQQKGFVLYFLQGVSHDSKGNVNAPPVEKQMVTFT